MGLYCAPRDCYCLLLPAGLPVVYPRCSSLSPRVCTSPPTSHTAHLALPHRVEKHAVSRRSCSMGSQWGHERESGLRGISCRGLGYEMVRVRVRDNQRIAIQTSRKPTINECEGEWGVSGCRGIALAAQKCEPGCPSASNPASRSSEHLGGSIRNGSHTRTMRISLMPGSQEPVEHT